MADKIENPLERHLADLVVLLREQLQADYKRWGDSWLKLSRPAEGQEYRIFERFLTYFEQWQNGGTPIPWLKIIGLCWIALMRDIHPEYLEEPNDVDIGEYVDELEELDAQEMD